jgi:hypothetical protein
VTSACCLPGKGKCAGGARPGEGLAACEP